MSLLRPWRTIRQSVRAALSELRAGPVVCLGEGGLMMRRREFLVGTAALGVTIAASGGPRAGQAKAAAAGVGGTLTPPANGSIPVTVAISERATVIDFAGPWEVVQDVHVPEPGSDMDEMMPFPLVTLAETTEPLRR